MSSQLDDNPETADPPDFRTLVVDRHAEVPIGVQLAWALRSRIADGQLTPGQRLPGLRDLAQDSGVNVNTVRAVYQRLDQEGLIESQQGSGTFVSATPSTRSPAGKIAAGAAREAFETGVDPREVAAALYVSAESRDAPRDAAAEQRRALRAQIGSLERTLAEMEAAHPALMSVSSAASAGIGPTLLSAAELEQIRGGLVRRLAAIQQALDSELGRVPAEQPARQRPADAHAPPAPAPSEPKKRGSARPRAASRPAPAGT